MFGFLPNEDADVPSVLSGTLGEIVPEEAVLDANAPLPSFATGMGRYQTGASRRSKPSEIRAEIRGSAEPSNSLAERGARPFRQIFSDGGDDNQNSRAEMEQYTVREGDTYLTICEQKYGTTLLYTALALHNRRNGATWKPMPGTVIEIPSADYLSKTYEDYLARSRNSGRPRPAERSATATTTRPPVVRMSQGRYITQQGDTVFKIAMNRLRDSSRWQEILKLNTEIVQNAYEPLPVGMEILLPVR